MLRQKTNLNEKKICQIWSEINVTFFKFFKQINWFPFMVFLIIYFFSLVYVFLPTPELVFQHQHSIKLMYFIYSDLRSSATPCHILIFSFIQTENTISQYPSNVFVWLYNTVYRVVATVSNSSAKTSVVKELFKFQYSLPLLKREQYSPQDH